MALSNLLSNPRHSPTASNPGHCARSRLASAGLLILAACIATAPIALHRALSANDLQFHLISWIDVQQNWGHGVVYPQWASSANFGAGEPRFIFYPPLTWVLGSALGLLLPWRFVPAALAFVLFAGVGFSTRALAREFLPEGAATLAGCGALFSGYALFTAYERAAFGELCASVWIPLILLFTLRERTPGTGPSRWALDRSALPLAIALAGAWLSDAPGGVMASYLLAGVTLVAAFRKRSWLPLMRAVPAFVLGMSLCAFYVLPAAWEQHWVDIQQSIGVNGDPGMRIENNWLFLLHRHLPETLRETELRFASIIAATMIGVGLLSAAVLWARRNSGGARPGPVVLQFPQTIDQRDSQDTRWWIPLALVLLTVLLLLLPVSLPLWNVLPKLRYLQFPWRWLMVVEAPMAVLFAAAAWSWATTLIRRRVVAAACCLFLLLSGSLAAGNFFRSGLPEDRLSSILSVASSGSGFPGSDEYAPRGADNSIVARGLPDVCLTDDFDTELGVAPNPEANPNWLLDQGSCVANVRAVVRLPNRLRVVLPPARPGFAILRLRSYPAWEITLNGQPVENLPVRADGLIAVPLPASMDHEPVELAARWTTTKDVLLGRWLSAAAWLLLVLVGLFQRRLASSRQE